MRCSTPIVCAIQRPLHRKVGTTSWKIQRQESHLPVEGDTHFGDANEQEAQAYSIESNIHCQLRAADMCNEDFPGCSESLMCATLRTWADCWMAAA